MANPDVLGAPSLGTSTGLQSRAPRGLLLRVRTLLWRPWLDRDIVRGFERPGNRALALREAQLVDPRERRRLAGHFERILAERARPEGPSSAVPTDREAVRVAKPVLTEIVLSLRSSEPIEARGVVLGRRLLTDPASPLYAPSRGPRGGRNRLRHESILVLLTLRYQLG